jgi:hypothetical protein
MDRRICWVHVSFSVLEMVVMRVLCQGMGEPTRVLPRAEVAMQAAQLLDLVPWSQSMHIL